MAGRKVCLIYVPELKGLALEVEEKLHASGAQVCAQEVELDLARAAELGFEEIPDPLKKCISDADECIFLVPDDGAGFFGGVANCASDKGKKLLSVSLKPLSEESIFDEIADNAVVAGSEQLDAALKGGEVWESGSNHSKGQRPCKRQEKQ